LKVLVLTSGGDAGGAKTHILSAFELMNKRVPNSCLMVSFLEGEFADEARKRGIPTEVINSGFINDIKRLKVLVNSGEFDIIHAHGSRANFMASLTKGALPTVSTIHSDYKLDYLGRPLANMTYGVINRIALRRLDYFIGVADVMTETLLDRGFPPENIFTIHNGIEIGDAIFKHKASSECVTIGIAARLNPVKDIATLIRAFARLVESTDMNLKLRIAGDGSEMMKLKSLATQLGVGDMVEFLGWITDMDEFYSTLDINVMCSISETFPYALLEGAKAGLATVSSIVGGIGNLIDDGVNGFLFKAGDSKTLAKCLLNYTSNAELRKEYGKLLHDKVAKIFSLDAMLNTQLAIYDVILRREKNKKRDGVAICGAYGMGNVGDEAILTSIIKTVRQTDADLPIYVLTKSPKQTRRVHRVRTAHTFNIFSFFIVAGKIKLYINGGGSLIQDETSKRSLWFYLYTILIAKLRGAKVMMYGCGIGPVKSNFDRKLAGRIINHNVTSITLRENGSLAELTALGVISPKVQLAADPVFALSGDITYNPESKFIAVALRHWKGIDNLIPELANSLIYAYEKYQLTPVFVPIDKQDVHVNAMVADLLPNHIPFESLQPFRMPSDIISAMSKMRVALSMRLHGLIFGASVGLPLIGIVYDPKVNGFLDYIGQPYYCDIYNADEKTIESLLDSVMSVDNSDTANHMRQLERTNSKVLSELLEEK